MHRNPSVMKHRFSEVPAAEIPRSSFDRSHGYKTAFDAGYLIPMFVDEALPGDTFNLRSTLFARLATPIFPIMDNIHLDTFYFAVPIRLVWDNWQKFNGEQRNPGDSTSYVVPQMVSPVGGYAIGSLSDYMGIPTGVAGMTHSSLFHRCYNLIFNEWFRDQNLQNSVVVDTDDGPDDPADYVLLRRGKRHDYFTSALPWPQKGPGVTIPLGTTAPVLGFGVNGANVAASVAYEQANGVDIPIGARGWSQAQALFFTDAVNSAGTAGSGGHQPALYADLSSASAATINTLRQAFQIQKIYERDARGGTRYTEIIKSHFGVTSPDARLQRPEYLGGGSTPVNVSAVPQTSSTVAGSPQGNLSAFGTALAQGNGFSMSFTEHCLIIGLVSARADLTYQQGLDRMFSRSTRFDFYWPALAHLGEQSILNKEIYADGSANDNLVFGYQERYAEYRYKPSKVTGLLRSSAAGTLDSWHLAQSYASLPGLNSTFIVEDPPIDRCIAVPTEPHFIMDGYHKLQCARPMPVYSVPGLIDHF